MNPRLAVVFLVLALGQYLSVSVVEAYLQCYDCKNCADPFKPDGISVTSCMMGCQKIKGKTGSEQYVIRGCGSTTETRCTETTSSGVDLTVCTCATDKCNTAATIQSPVLLFGTLGAALLIIKRL